MNPEILAPIPAPDKIKVLNVSTRGWEQVIDFPFGVWLNKSLHGAAMLACVQGVSAFRTLFVQAANLL